MKTINVNELINNIDDSLIEKAISIDDAYKLKKAKEQEKAYKPSSINLFRKISLGLSFACVVVVGVFILNFNKENNSNIEIPSPITEVSTLAEMEEMLEFSVPIIQSKTVSQYIVLNNDGTYYLGRIIYTDNSEFSIAKSSEDISGIYGSTLLKEITINNINVNIYTMENIKYATWTYNDFSYSYTIGDTDDLEIIVKEIINKIKERTINNEKN